MFYKKDLIIAIPTLEVLIRLDKVLNQILKNEFYGLFAPYRFYPSILPNKDYWVVTSNGNEQHLTGDQIIDYVLNVKGSNSTSLTSAIFSDKHRITDEFGSIVIDDVNKLSSKCMYPYGARKFIIEYTNILINDKSAYIDYNTNDLIASALICAYPSIFNTGIEIVDEYLYTIEDILGDYRAVVIEIAINYKWHELVVELADDIVLISSIGDYRINSWMNQNNRSDF